MLAANWYSTPKPTSQSSPPPPGKVFRLSGYFHTKVESNDPYIVECPGSSTTAWLEDDRGSYEPEPVDFFEGRFLSVGLDNGWLEPSQQLDADDWKDHRVNRSSDERPPELNIQVIAGDSEVIDLADRLQRRGVSVPDSNNPSGESQWFFDLPLSQFAYVFSYAETTLARVEIELVPDTSQSQQPTLEAVSTRRLRRLWLPLWERADGDPEDFAEGFHFAFGAAAHPEWGSPGRRLHLVRGGVDIDTYAKLAEKDDLPTPVIAMDSPKGHRYWQEQQRQKKRTTLTLIENVTGRVCLEKLAKVFGDPDWLENRLSKSWGWNREDEEF